MHIDQEILVVFGLKVFQFEELITRNKNSESMTTLTKLKIPTMNTTAVQPKLRARVLTKIKE